MTRTAWFLDYDGSLCPHQEVWEQRQYDVAAILKAVNHLQSRCAGVYWNTGRRKDSLAGVSSDLLKFDGYFVMGSYRWDAASTRYERLGPTLPQELADFYEKRLLSEQQHFKLEIKESALRIAPLESRYRDALSQWLKQNDLAAFARDSGLAKIAEPWQWILGNRGIELLAKGFDKGFALRTELASRPQLIPVVVGDDFLDATAVQEALDRGGYVFLVGDNCGWISKLKHQSWQLHFYQEPSDLLRFLTAL